LPLENSLAAFDYALEQGCDGFECDGRRTRDGHNVIWHDPQWKGMEIVSADYAGLADRDGRRPATIDQVLAQFGQRAYLDLELKTGGWEESVVASLKANTPRRGFIVSSFLTEVLVRLHDLESDLPLGYICDRPDALSAWQDLPLRVLLPRHDLIRPRLIEQVHNAGRQIMTWTVNSAVQIRCLAAWGIDGLISDDPRLLCAALRNE
jgi:glycerophosphoryl diester phosphodiesterase